MATDIIARLQLKAEQFTSEAGQAMTRLKEVSRSAASEVRREFLGALGDVQKTAQTALALPRVSGGGLDLSQEIAQLRAQEAAAQNSAQAQRELAAAASTVAARGGESAAAQRLTADAAMVAERASIEEATAIRAKITAYEELQAELNKVATGTHKFTDEQLRLAGVSRSSGAGFTNLGQQFGDFTVQVVSGQSAAIAFAQQLPQAAYAASTMGGALGKVGGFLTGPWGTALTIATVVAVPFVSKLLDGADAAEEQSKKLAQAAQAADSYGSAQSLLGKIIDLTTGKLKTQNEVLIQTIKLQAQANILKAQEDQKKAATALKDLASPSLLERLSVTSGGTPFAANGSAAQDQANKLTEALKPFKAAVADYINLVNDPRASQAQLSAGLDDTIGRIDKLAKANRLAKRDVIEAKQAVLALGTTLNDQRSNQQVLDAIDGKGVAPELVPYKRDPKPKKSPKPKDFSRSDDAAEQAITAINAEWDDQPRLIDKARLATLKLDNLTEQLSKRKLTPEVQKLLGMIGDAREAIEGGLDRPYRDFVKSQRESLEIGRLVLAGRDAEADALQNILRLEQIRGVVTAEQVESALRLAQQHQALTRLLEDQRRVVGIYENAWSGVRDQVDGVFAKIQGGAGGIVGVVQKLQRDLLSNALFGGIDREIEDYIRQATGKRTPAEILQAQAADAGAALRTGVNDFVDIFQEASLRIKGIDPAATRDATILAAPYVTQYLGSGGKPGSNDNEILVTAKKTSAADTLLGRVIDKAAENFRKIGIDVPTSIIRGLKQNLPTVLQGAGFGGIGGSIFSAIGGKKADGTASTIGGIAGDYVGKELGKLVPQAATGLLKTLGGAAGPIGAVVGGLLGNVVGGLFKKTERGSAQISSVDQAAVVNGNYSAVQSDLGGLATNVQTGIRQIADALGASVGSFAVSINKYKDSYRVDPSGGTSVGGKYGTNDGVLKFDGDAEGAVRAAIANALADGAIKGISDASQRILASGKDLESAINKAVLIEAVPKNLKKLIDPVGAAIDDLNRDFKKTVDALKEGGATAEQMAQAQQLYNLQLDQVKASTASASATLKDFLSSLKLGSNSPYSLRDQEGEAIRKLQPFLDHISAGKSIDQSAYQSAANAAIDIERQIYGSTKQFFDFLDLIQGATNKAIGSIDNATPVSAAVERPFAKATADSAAATAKGIGTSNDLLEQLSNLMAQNNELLAQLSSDGRGSGFVSENRNFART